MAESREERERHEKGRMTIVWFIILFVLLIIISLPTVTLVFFGMLPTIVAYIVDNTKQKYTTACVGGLNFCGVFPYILDLWMTSHTLDYAKDLLTDVFALLVMYGAAAFGWMIFVSIPPVVLAILNVIAQRRVATLRNNQVKIIEEWGRDVAMPDGDLTDTPLPDEKKGKDKKQKNAADLPEHKPTNAIG